MMKMELKDSNQVEIFGPNYEKKYKQTVDPKNGLLTYYEQGPPTG